MNEDLLKKVAQEMGRRGGKASAGTPQAKIRASKAGSARASWSRHAPGHVRDMFLEAIEAYVQWDTGDPEPTVEYEDQQIPISKACRILWNCNDILPVSDYDSLKDGCGMEIGRQTYAAAAHAMLAAIKEETTK